MQEQVDGAESRYEKVAFKVIKGLKSIFYV